MPVRKNMQACFVLPVHCMAELLQKLRNSVLQFEGHYDKITYVVIKERWSAAAADAEGASGRKKEKQIRAGLRCGFEPFILAV